LFAARISRLWIVWQTGELHVLSGWAQNLVVALDQNGSERCPGHVFKDRDRPDNSPEYPEKPGPDTPDLRETERIER
jgi:hypothetical protein